MPVFFPFFAYYIYETYLDPTVVPFDDAALVHYMSVCLTLVLIGSVIWVRAFAMLQSALSSHHI